MTKCVKIGGATLYLADCLDVLPALENVNVDALVTDPPYGLNEAAGKSKSRNRLAVLKDFGSKSWDDQTKDREINAARKQCAEQVIFGGNYYDLPRTSCWLVWDKINGKSDFADCELAWTNLQGAVRLKRFMWNGMLRDGNERRGDHPTQKPVSVMEWAISFTKGKTVLDPFMGSGTTGVACANLGREFIGIEKEPEYFEIACERIEAAHAQGRLFK